jgi:hypothetical protein
MRVDTFVKSHWPQLCAVALTLAACIAATPITRNGSHKGRLVLAGVAIVLVQLGFWAHKQASPRREQLGRWITTAWIAAALVGVFNYYNFAKKEFTTIGDYADASYYYLNSKYFAELGYPNFYEAVLVADEEGPRRFTRVTVYRDLSNYRDLHPRRHALERADVVKSRFSAERWDAFKHDVDFLYGHGFGGTYNYYFIDHGYNPPPAWTLIGGTLATHVAVEDLKWVTSIDIVLIALAMLAIYRVAGLQSLLISLVFFLCTFSGRWPVLGHAMLRFDWLAALVFFVLALRSGRHGLAGACLAYAALIRIFPAIFGLAYGATMLRTWVVERRFPAEQKRFLAGGVAMLLILGGASGLYVGKQGVEESIARLALHSSPEAFSSRRIGLATILTYEGEWSRKDINENGGIEQKRADLWELQPYLKMLGILLVVAAGAFVWWQRQKPHRHTWLALYPLFASTFPQANYYNLRLLPVLFHTEEMRNPRDRVGLSMLFLVEVATQGAQVAGGDYYAWCVAASFGLLAYLVVMAVFLARERPAGAEQPAGSAPSVAKAAA